MRARPLRRPSAQRSARCLAHSWLAPPRPLPPPPPLTTHPPPSTPASTSLSLQDAELLDTIDAIDVPSTSGRGGGAPPGAEPRLLQLVAAWDALSVRLPPGPAFSGAGADVLLRALKLVLAHATPEGAARGLALAGRLAAAAGGASPLDAEAVAAGAVAEAFRVGAPPPAGLLEACAGAGVAGLLADLRRVRALPSRVDLYDDEAAAALRDLCLAFYDVRATAVEVVARLAALRAALADAGAFDDGEDLVAAAGGEELSSRAGAASPAAAGARADLQAAALEALQLYAPMGHALGLAAEAAALEDAACRALFPASYAATAAWLAAAAADAEAPLRAAAAALEAAAAGDARLAALAGGVEARGRTKTRVSTLRKLLRLGDTARGGRPREEIYDLHGLRAVVSPRADLPPAEAEAAARAACYAVEAAAHALWPPVAGRSKDYVAAPKPNGYASLHSAVRLPAGPAGAPATVELQVRTAAMHAAAESGEAAHGAYKGGLAAEQAARLREWTAALLARGEASTGGASSGAEEDSSNGRGGTAAEALFRHLDLDGNGRVSAAELRHALAELGGAPGADGDPGARALLALAEASGGGEVSLEEFLGFQRRAGLLAGAAALDAAAAAALPPRGRPVSNARGSAALRPPRRAAGRPASPTRDAAAEAFAEGGGPGAVADVAPRAEAAAAADSDALTARRATPPPPPPPPRAEPELLQKPPRPAAAWPPNGPAGGLRRMFSPAGVPRLGAAWELAPLPSAAGLAADAAGLPAGADAAGAGALPLPRHGPCVVGGARGADVDLLLDVPTVSGRHARFEVRRARAPGGAGDGVGSGAESDSGGGGAPEFDARAWAERRAGRSHCTVVDLGSTNGTFVNRTRIAPGAEVRLYPGDVVCLAEPGIAFEVRVADEGGAACSAGGGGSSATGPAVAAALRLAAALEAEAAARGVFAPAAASGAPGAAARALIATSEFQAAYMLLLGAAMAAPADGGLWAQLGALERQRARRREQGSTPATARALLRAAAEAFEAEPDASARRAGLARLFSAWALAEFSLGNDASARALFNKAVRAARRHPGGAAAGGAPRVLLSWAARERARGDAPRAARLAREALAVDPSNARVLTLLAALELEAGDVAAARALFARAAAAAAAAGDAPGAAAALQGAARLEAGAGALDAARGLFAAALAAAPDSPHALQAWAVAEGRAGRRLAARALFRRCLAADPACHQAWHAWGAMEAGAGDARAARELFARALALRPRSPETLAALAHLERRAGDLGAAEAAARAALAAEPAHAPALGELAAALAARGAGAEARRARVAAERANATRRARLAAVRLAGPPPPGPPPAAA